MLNTGLHVEVSVSSHDIDVILATVVEVFGLSYSIVVLVTQAIDIIVRQVGRWVVDGMECNLVAWCSTQAVISIACYLCVSVTHAINCVSGLVNWYILSVAVESFVLFKLISVFIRLLVGFGRCSKAVDDKDGRTGKVVDDAISSGNFVIKYQALFGYLSLGIVIHSVIVAFLTFLLCELYSSNGDLIAVCVGAGYIIFFLVVLEGDEVFGTGGANRKFVLIDVHFMSDIISTAIFRNLSEEWAIAWNSDCADR